MAGPRLQSHVFWARIWCHPDGPSDDAGDGAAFQAQASLNTQATDPKRHTLVRTFYIRFSPSRYLLNSDGRP